MPAAGGLSDALGRLASEDDRKPRAVREPEVEIRSARSLRADETTVLSVDEILSEPSTKPRSSRGSQSGASKTPAGKPRPSATQAMTPARPAATRRTTLGRNAGRKSANHELKRTAIPILITVGLVLMVPGLWAVGLLIGLEVPRHEDPKANQMALAMLISWPMSLCMIAGAIFFWVQTRGGKPDAHRR